MNWVQSYRDYTAPIPTPRNLSCIGQNMQRRELNPGPLAPEARIIPLDRAAGCDEYQHAAV